MPKVLITADLHIHPHRSDMRRVEDGLECLRWIYKTAEIADCCNVIIAGDFLHNRFSLNSYAYSKACNIVSQSTIRTIFLLGNHDMYYEDNWDVHSLTPLKGLATVVDRPRTIDLHGYPVDFLPYTPHPSRYLPDFTEPSNVLISHLAVSDALLNARNQMISVEDDSKEKEIISPSAFAKWKKVWLGHYHYGQEVSEIVEYIGSPMQLTYGEAGQRKHVGIFDLDTLQTNYVVNDRSPQFHIVERVDELDHIDVTNSYVQIRCQQAVDEEPIETKFDIRRKLSKLGAREIEIQPIKADVNKQTSKALENITQFFNDRNKLIGSYVDAADTGGLDKELLKKIGLQIVG